MKKFLSFLLIFSFLHFSYSQSRDKKPIDSRDLILDGLDYHDDEKYDKAIEKYLMVNENDTNYQIALGELTFSLMMDEQYEECIKYCEEGLERDPNDVLLYNNMASAYEELNQFDKAIEVYDKGLALFPVNYLLYYNKALSYQKDEQFDKAVEEYKKGLIYNPFHSTTHYRLSDLSSTEGKLTQCAMSGTMFLLLNPDNVRGDDMLGVLSTYLTEKPNSETHDIKFSNKGDEFDEIDEILKSQVALSNKYKFNSDLDYDLIRQLHAMLTLLADYEPNGGYYDEFFVPFYQEIMEKDLFEGFTYFIAASSSSENVQSTIKKNMKELEAFAEWFYSEGIDHFRYDKDDLYTVSYGYPYEIYGIGPMKNEEKHGEWTFYHEEGSVMSQGKFDEKGKTGLWKWYYVSGELEYEIEFEDGERNGSYKRYHKNGNLFEEGTYEDGKAEGKYFTYYPNGGKESEFNYKESKFEGLQKTFYKNGQQEYGIEFKDDEQHGKHLTYYINGAISSDYEMKEGKKHGDYVSYFPNGEKEFVATYKDGEVEGPFVRYYSNGVVNYEGTAKDGVTIGEYNVYFRNGELLEEIVYDESGKLNGIKKEYEVDGKLYFETEYTKGEQTNYKYFDKKGNLVIDQKVKNKEDLKIYFSTGELKGVGQLLKGERDGKWTFYFPNGDIESTGSYTNGERDGTFKWYYENGQLASTVNFSNDVEEGYFKSYYRNSNLKSEGYYKEGQKVGEWKYYYSNGNLSGEEYYLGGLINGKDKSYDVNGYLDAIAKYDLDEFTGISYFDTLGNEYYSMNPNEFPENHTENVPYTYNNKGKYVKTYVNGELNGPYESFYPNGQKDIVGQFINGTRDGDWTWYHPDGTLDAKRSYNIGYSNGKVEEFSIMEFKIYEGEIIGDEYEGIFTYYYPDGKKMKEVMYVNDDLNGFTTYFDENEKAVLSIYYLNNYPLYYVTYSNGESSDNIEIKQGTASIVAKYADGKEAIRLSFANGLYDEELIIFDTKGNKRYVCKYKDGYYDGLRIFYHPNSKQEWIKYPCKEGNYHGTAVKYYADGKKNIEIDMNEDIFEGNLIKYDQSGAVKFKAKYYNDEVYEIE